MPPSRFGFGQALTRKEDDRLVRGSSVMGRLGDVAAHEIGVAPRPSAASAGAGGFTPL
jgi:hypothetical protein